MASADLSRKTTGWLQALIEADASIEGLYHTTLHVQLLTTRIDLLLKTWHHSSNHNNHSIDDPAVRQRLTHTREVLQSCIVAVQSIEKKLKPSAVRPGTVVTKRVRHLWSALEIQSRKKVIDMHLDSLAVNLTILCQLNSASSLRAFQDETLRAAASVQPETLQTDLHWLEREAQSSTRFAACDAIGFDNLEIPQSALSEAQLDGEMRRRNISTSLEDPTSSAVQQEATHEVQMRVDEDPRIPAMESGGWTELHRALQHGNHAMVSQLLQSPGGSKPSYAHAMTKRNYAVLMLLIQQAESSDIMAMMNRGYDLSVFDDSEHLSCPALSMLFHEPETEAGARSLNADHASIHTVGTTLTRNSDAVFVEVDHASTYQSEPNIFSIPSPSDVRLPPQESDATSLTSNRCIIRDYDQAMNDARSSIDSFRLRV